MARQAMTSCFIVIMSSVVLQSFSTAALDKWVDLTYRIAENETIYWPGQPPWQHDIIMNGFIAPGIFVRGYKFAAGEHGGTHMDAPTHFVQNGALSVDRVSIDNLHGNGIVVNISAKAHRNPNAELEISDLEDWEKKHGAIPDKPVVFLYCGRGKYWPDKTKYFGSNTPGNLATFNFPGLNSNAAKWLIDNKNLKLFGLDTPSLDPGNSTELKTHRVLLGAGIPGLENVANLDKLPPRGFEVFAFPIKIKDGSGGPTRVFAKIAADPVDVHSLATNCRVSIATVSMVLFVTMVL